MNPDTRAPALGAKPSRACAQNFRLRVAPEREPFPLPPPHLYPEVPLPVHVLTPMEPPVGRAVLFFLRVRVP